MITIKNPQALSLMKEAGKRLATIFVELEHRIVPGVATFDINAWIEDALKKHSLVSQSLGYHGYRHVSCISVNDELVHGIPSKKRLIASGDVVKVDVCAAFKGHCADMARCFAVPDASGMVRGDVSMLLSTAQRALDCGIAQAVEGNRLFDISAAIQKEIERQGCGVVRDYCGHGIGRAMHEDPEIPNYGTPGTGPRLRAGMTFALEPMLSAGKYDVVVADDGWTVLTEDGSLTAHVEDTVVVTDAGPEVITRL